MTSVLGHLTKQEFEPRFRSWKSCQPGQLFEAGVVESVDEVRYGSEDNRTMSDRLAGQESASQEH